MSDQSPAEVRRKPRVSPFRFLQEVREETRKVTWPSRKETMITTAMVFVMVAIASVFFLVADQIIRIAVTFVLGIGTLKRTSDERYRHRYDDQAKALVHRPRLFELREEGRRIDPLAGQAAQSRRSLRGDHGADRNRGRGAPWPQSECRAQVFPGLRAGQDGFDRRSLPSDQEHPESHRLSRHRQEADADFGD